MRVSHHSTDFKQRDFYKGKKDCKKGKWEEGDQSPCTGATRKGRGAAADRQKKGEKERRMAGRQDPFQKGTVTMRR